MGTPHTLAGGGGGPEGYKNPQKWLSVSQRVRLGWDSGVRRVGREVLGCQDCGLRIGTCLNGNLSV